MKTIRDLELNEKKVLIRVDFNVPIVDGKITDDTRIKESLKTINYALEKNAKVILLSHLGRVKTKDDLKNTLEPVALRLAQLVDAKVKFINETRGSSVEKLVNELESKEILLLENTRFEDLESKKESSNDLELGKYWASLADVFINDAFGTAHREHASNVGIANNLESGIGFLIEKELENFESIINNPKRPFTIILGGAKIASKIGLIKSLVTKADYILIGGGMSYTFLKSLGLEVGQSIMDENSIDFCKEILSKYKEKIILPTDIVTQNGEVFVSDMNKDSNGFDIGKKTVKLFKEYLEKSQTIIWNGPVGFFEKEEYQSGTKGICEILKDLDCIKVAGGGDTASAVKQFGYENVFTHISTGGGASLELLEGKKLPGIEAIK